jgi:PGAP1-like protein
VKRFQAGGFVHDARGVVQLAARATVGVADVAESVHQAVWANLGLSAAEPGRTRGLTGLIYRSVRGVASGVGLGLDAMLYGAVSWLDATPREDDNPQRAAVLAALNGVLGDQLAAQGNPLALTMRLRTPEPAVAPSARLLLFIHGLCMHDGQWQDAQTGIDGASALAAQLGCTPVFLGYNTGLHISANGRALSVQLQQLVAGWPVPVREISIVGHSMGGLVARSAAHWAQIHPTPWRALLRHMVFLGTPHHGAPLERAGHWVDIALASTPYSAPFAKLAHLRSAGITDLRHGNVIDAHWVGQDRFAPKAAHRVALPLPSDVACYAVAASLAARDAALAQRLVGDGLVPLRSALGQHDAPDQCLALPKAHQHTVYGTGHLALMHHPAVWRTLRAWLTDPP